MAIKENASGTHPKTDSGAARPVVNQEEKIERIYRQWDEALSHNDMTALLALYAQDATIESPLIPHLLSKEKGICRGHEEIQPLLEEVARRKPKTRRYYRTPYMSDGKKFMWEYPREAPEGDQMDFVEAMELNEEGLIQHHRVYWGWFGFGVLQRGQYER